MNKESYELIKFRYEHGVYSLDYMCNLVKIRELTEEEFHSITTYSYKGLINTLKGQE